MDMELPESVNSRDARIEALWKKLDPQGKGELDINGLQKGLRKIDHPLKNASDLIKDVVNAMDKNGDHVIQYEEFRSFVMHTENELFSLFKSIDRDHNGKLDKGELKAAFKRAGLAVPAWKLDQFFAEVDGNHDGYITFDEWRDFLLFLPTNTQNPPLKAVLSYYSSTFALNAEGDTSIREETLEGLGTTSPMLFNIFFGVLVKIAKPSLRNSSFQPESATVFGSLPDGTADTNMLGEANQAHFIEGAFGPNARPDFPFPIPSTPETDDEDLSSDVASPMKSRLTSLLPDSGYFAIGACAGVISRTCTAPLDRLKVYLIAHTSPVGNSLDAAKKGNVGEATRKFGQPIILAYKDLLQAGGWRNLFAGNGLNVLKVAPESAIRFGSFEAAKRVLAHLEGHEDPKTINPYSKFLAGGFGGVMSQLVVYPVDTLKFRMQCETVSGGLHGNALIAEVFKKMQKQGYRAFYRGLNLGLIGMFPYSAIDLGTFEFLKASLTRANAKKLGCHEEDAEPGPFATAFIGAFSGALGASAVYPINLLRTRLQAQGTVLHPPTYDGFMDVFRKTVKNEGVSGLFKGITPNLIKVAPSISITYVVYESGKKFLNLR